MCSVIPSGSRTWRRVPCRTVVRYTRVKRILWSRRTSYTSYTSGASHAWWVAPPSLTLSCSSEQCGCGTSACRYCGRKWSWVGSAVDTAGPTVSAAFYHHHCYNNNNNTLIYIAPACRMTSEALADSSSRATECITRSFSTLASFPQYQVIFTQYSMHSVIH